MTIRVSLKHLLWGAGAVLVLSVGASAALLWPTSDSTVAGSGADEPPPPQVVTLEELSPEQVMRVYLQAWYRRDFLSQYMFLSPDLQEQVSREAFIERMQKELPAVTGLRIMNIRTDALSDTETTVGVELTATKEDGASDTSSISFSFVKTSQGWRLRDIPSLISK